MGELVHLRRRRDKGPKAQRSGLRLPRGQWVILAALLSAGAAGYYGPGIVSRYAPEMGSAVQGNASQQDHTLIGRASVTDGDTIEIHGERIRFNGIDAPESAQTCNDRNGKAFRCGAQAAEALAGFLAQASPTKCDFVERDQYGRFVGDCYRVDGTSVQLWLVGSGWAMDWPRYSGGAYAKREQAAKAARLGIWAGTVQPPWEWRADQRQQQTETKPVPIAPLIGTSSAGGCNIKGNVSAKGERIYHMPGQQHYAKTIISESKGERWFCSEAEARSAGWRAAKR